jgi:saccharopine dehydrogenase-like NADP-dependent oxidoreductase
MRVAVIGAGAMGRVALAELLRGDGVETVVVADVALAAASRGAIGAQDRVQPLQLDAMDGEAVRKAIRGCDAVINAAHYHTNVPVLRAAIAEGVHYTDLGGLFHTTRAQRALDAEAKAAGVTAILGMGGAPGITNLMARYLADRMDAVHALHVILGSIDRTPSEAALPVPYSIRTILDECTLPPMVFTGGAFREAAPFDGAIEVTLPAPVGAVTAHYTLHSEVATLPLTYAEKGIREVSFRIAFPQEFARKLRLLVDLGLGSTDPVDVQGQAVIPREVLVALIERQPAGSGPVDDCDALRVVAEGMRGGAPVGETMDLLFPSHDGLSGGAFDTGVPPAIVARMLARGEVGMTGVLVPEECLDPAALFDALAARGPIMGWPRR